MKRRSLVACTALVLMAHAGVIVGVGHGHAAVPGQPAAPPARSVLSLVRALAPQAPMAVPAGAGTPPPRSASRQIDAPPREARRITSASTQGAGIPSMAGAAGAAVYRPGTDLDVPARPRSSPDLAMLSGLPWSGLPLRMRLYIDSDGLVVDTQVLQSAESPDVTERVRQMFLATSFTAGMEGGRAVPCFKDIELNVGAS
ncbi:MAG: hypothetical protein ACJ8G1_10940 [Vitreoscilla sp.]